MCQRAVGRHGKGGPGEDHEKDTEPGERVRRTPVTHRSALDPVLGLGRKAKQGDLGSRGGGRRRPGRGCGGPNHVGGRCSSEGAARGLPEALDLSSEGKGLWRSAMFVSSNR